LRAAGDSKPDENRACDPYRAEVDASLVQLDLR
jgi:hypothetical protein